MCQIQTFCAKLEEKKMMNGVTNLDCTVILVVGEAERAEWAVHTVQAIHVAFTLVRISM